MSSVGKAKDTTVPLSDTTSDETSDVVGQHEDWLVNRSVEHLEAVHNHELDKSSIDVRRESEGTETSSVDSHSEELIPNKRPTRRNDGFCFGAAIRNRGQAISEGWHSFTSTVGRAAARARLWIVSIRRGAQLPISRGESVERLPANRLETMIRAERLAQSENARTAFENAEAKVRTWMKSKSPLVKLDEVATEAVRELVATVQNKSVENVDKEDVDYTLGMLVQSGLRYEREVKDAHQDAKAKVHTYLNHPLSDEAIAASRNAVRKLIAAEHRKSDKEVTEEEYTDRFRQLINELLYT